MQTPLSAPGRSGPTQSSNVRVPSAGEDARRNWISLAQTASALAGQAGGLQSLKDQVNALKYISRALIDLHPFKIYQLPSLLRANGGDPATDWRKFRVRAGRVLETDADGTDADADPTINADPDSERVPLNNIDISVPSGTANFWFWLEISVDEDSATTAVVRYGPDPTVSTYTDGANPDNSWDTDNPWTNFPKPDSGHVPIGWVDTATAASSNTPIVRQYLRADLVFLGGSECS